MASVHITNRVTLRPGREVSPIKFDLTSFERVMRKALYQKRVLFYKQPITSSTLQLLKESLREALVLFFPLAGRIRIVPSTVSGLQLDCTDPSIIFTEARTESVISQLGDFQPSEFCDSLCEIGNPTYPWDPQTPLLFVQVTRFSCGGTSIGAGFSHQVCDGPSFWHFMNSWGEIARTGKTSIPPEVTYAYRGLEMNDQQLRKAGESVGLKFKDTPAENFDRTSLTSLRPPKAEKLDIKLYKLDRATLQQLKSMNAAEPDVEFTTLELVCANFWKMMAIARDGIEDSKRYTFTVLINTRGKLPLVSKTYFGNAIASAMVTATFGEIRRRGVWFAARLLQQGIRRPVKQLEETLELFGRWASDSLPTTLLASLDTSVVVDTAYSMVVSSPRHPVYETDFGFGKAAGVTFGRNDLNEGKLYLFPSAAGDGGIDAFVVLKPEDIAKLPQYPLVDATN